MRRSVWLMIVLIVLTFSMGLTASAQDESVEDVHVFTSPVETYSSQGDVRIIEGSTAWLMTSDAGIAVSMSTSELEADHVYTLLVMIVNKPAACASQPCTPNDVLSNPDGVQAEVTRGDTVLTSAKTRSEFSVFVPAGDFAEGWYGNGLANPTGATVYLLINDHGVYIPEIGATMLNTYRGGCADESLPVSFPSTAKADGEPGPNTCRLVQTALFAQAGDPTAIVPTPQMLLDAPCFGAAAWGHRCGTTHAK